MILPVAAGLLLGHGLAFPSRALAQHSVNATQAVRFAVLPVHTAASVLAPSSIRSEKVTVSLSLPPEGPRDLPGAAKSITLTAPASSLLPRAGERSFIVTITD